MYFNELDAEQKTAEQNNLEQKSDRINRLKMRIQELMRGSREQAFTDYLYYMQKQVNDAENRVAFLEADLEKQYRNYQMNLQKRSAQVQAQTPMTMQTQAQVQAQTPMPIPAQTQMPMPTQAPAQIQMGQPASRQPSRLPKDKNVEFAVGAAALGILGSAFVLTAMVLLGMYFLDGALKGLVMYLVSLLVVLLSELLLYKRFPRLGMLFSAIGMAGLYVSTVVNYLALGNFDEWVAMGATAVVTIAAILLSRKRDAGFYRILGMIAMYCCFFIALREKNLTGDLLPIQLVAMSVMLFIIHIMCMAVPVKKLHGLLNVTHLTMNTLFSAVIYLAFVAGGGSRPEAFANLWSYLFFLAVSVLIMQMIFVVQIRYRGSVQNTDEIRQAAEGHNLGIYSAYAVSAVFYMILLQCASDYHLWEAMGSVQGWQCRLCSAGISILCLIPIIFLPKKKERWISWAFLCMVVFDIYLLHIEDMRETIWATLFLLAGCRLVGLSKIILTQICDVIITAVACTVCALTVFDYGFGVTFPLFAGILFSVVLISYWKTYYEIILTYTIAWYVSCHMLNMLRLPVFVGILLLGILLFNNVKRWQEKETVVFTIAALVGQAVCFVMLLMPVYRNAYLTYLCMLIFGITTITICLQHKYGLDFNGKYMVLPGFFTYMALVIKIGSTVVNSILLMCIALGCVGVGFYLKKKLLRVYGLVLSLIVCAKLVIFDFMGSNIMMRTVMFFVVGVLALIIASIYIVLEKNQGKKDQGI